jgi:hypothetical protein
MQSIPFLYVFLRATPPVCTFLLCTLLLCTLLVSTLHSLRKRFARICSFFAKILVTFATKQKKHLQILSNALFF